MAESLWEWSRTAATNASADSGINWAEGMSPAAINNSARGMMAALAKYLYDQSGQIVTAGTSTVYTATTTSGLGSYAEGRMLCVEMDETCGATPTMNVDGLGAKKLYRYASTGVVQIAANEMRAGGRYILQYDTSLDAAAGGWVVLNASFAALSSVATGDIANDAVTYPKIQNVTAQNRILARFSSGAGDIEEATLGTGVSFSGGALTVAGRVAQVVNTTTGAVATGTTTLPADDTIPQITEGNEFITRSITPTNASSTLVIEVSIVVAHGVAGTTLTCALFQDATANALAAVAEGYSTADNMLIFSFRHVMVAGTTSATTFRVRAGAGAAGTMTFNGTATVRRFGGVMSSSIVITEFAP